MSRLEVQAVCLCVARRLSASRVGSCAQVQGHCLQGRVNHNIGLTILKVISIGTGRQIKGTIAATYGKNGLLAPGKIVGPVPGGNEDDELEDMVGVAVEEALIRPPTTPPTIAATIIMIKMMTNMDQNHRLLRPHILCSLGCVVTTEPSWTSGGESDIMGALVVLIEGLDALEFSTAAAASLDCLASLSANMAFSSVQSGG